LSARHLALDLGAESGRAVVGTLVDGRLHLEEVHRFPNRPVRLPSGLHWDVLALFAGIQDGIAAAEAGGPLASMAVDAWGVDYALLDDAGRLLGNPFHYRDARTDGMLDQALGRVPRRTIFQRTGVQFLQINSLYQLMSERALSSATTFLTIPDLFSYWLSGEIACEITNASTTQCFDPRANDWARDMLGELGIPTHIFPPVVQAGTSLGDRVIATAAHDTASAVVGTPLLSASAAYISSGTWSLVGVERASPILDDRALELNLTNEIGAEHTFRVLRNVMGLWLVQGIRRSQPGLDYAELMRMAESADPFQAVIDPDAPDLLHPADMPTAIRLACGVPVDDLGSLTRIALESLALRYRWVLDRLGQITADPIDTLHVVGGGARNRLLCQMTANATGRPVHAGPVEATAIGNILVQAIARGELASVAEGRALVWASFPPDTYEPRDASAWQDAYGRFQAKLAR
jgi:rhamnulokinase